MPCPPHRGGGMKLLAGLVALFAIAGAGTATQGAVAGQPAGWTGDTGSVGTQVDAMLPDGYSNPRSAEQAVAWALSQVGVVRDAGFCLRFAGFGIWAQFRPGSAYPVWTGPQRAAPHRGCPRGALVVWSSAIGRGHGHIAISLGDGRMVSTTSAAVSILPIQGFSDSAYYGWMPLVFTSDKSHHKNPGRGVVRSPTRVVDAGSAPPGTRTPNPLVKSQLLCQLS